MPLYQPDLTVPVLDQFSLNGRIAAVTGGARGIGLQVVNALAEAGADVAIVYKSTTAAPDIAKDIARRTGRRIAAFYSDVTERKTIAETLDYVATTFGHGRLDVVIANAGVCTNVSSLDYTEETWARDNHVNYDGAMWTAQAAGRIFKRQGRGNLIITASVSSILVNVPQHQAAYNASKAAVAHLAKGLAVEWVDFARVNCISPGYIQTEMVTTQPKERLSQWLAMIPARRMASAAELKAAYVFLASDACPYMTGAQLFIDGGFSLN